MAKKEAKQTYRTPEGQVQKVFRISKDNARRLAEIAKLTRRTEKATIEIMIEEAAKKEKIK